MRASRRLTWGTAACLAATVLAGCGQGTGTGAGNGGADLSATPPDMAVSAATETKDSREAGRSHRERDGLVLEVLSSRPEFVSGGDALVSVRLPSGDGSAHADPAGDRDGHARGKDHGDAGHGTGGPDAVLRVELNGKDITEKFAASADGRWTALVEGLPEGALGSSLDMATSRTR